MNQAACNRQCTCNEDHNCCNCCHLMRSNIIGVVYDKDLTLDELKGLIHYFFNYYHVNSHQFRIYYSCTTEEFCRQYGIDPAFDDFFRTLGKSQLNYWHNGGMTRDNYETLIREVINCQGILLFLHSKNDKDHIVNDLSSRCKNMQQVICIDLNVSD